jgi:hypothetical protein
MNAAIVWPSALLLCWAALSLFFLQDIILIAVAAIKARVGNGDFFILGVFVMEYLFSFIIREIDWYELPVCKDISGIGSLLPPFSAFFWDIRQKTFPEW